MNQAAAFLGENWQTIAGILGIIGGIFLKAGDRKKLAAVITGVERFAAGVDKVRPGEIKEAIQAAAVEAKVEAKLAKLVKKITGKG